MAVTDNLIAFMREYLAEFDLPEESRQSVYTLSKKHGVNTGVAYRVVKGEVHQTAFMMVSEGKSIKEIQTAVNKQRITIKDMWSSGYVTGVMQMPVIRRSGLMVKNKRVAMEVGVPGIMLPSTSCRVSDVLEPMIRTSFVGIMKKDLIPEEVLSAWIAYNEFMTLNFGNKVRLVPIEVMVDYYASLDLWKPVSVGKRSAPLYTEYEIACIKNMYANMNDMAHAITVAKVPSVMYRQMAERIDRAIDNEITQTQDGVNMYESTFDYEELPFDIDNLVDVCICAMRISILGIENIKGFYNGQGPEIIRRATKCFKALREFDIEAYEEAWKKDKFDREMERKQQQAEEQKIIKDELQTRLDQLTLPKVEYTAAWAMETIQSHLDCQHEKSPIVLCYNLRHTHNVDIDSVSYAAVEKFLKVTNIVIRTEVWKDQEAMIEGGTMVLKALLHLESEERRAAQERPFDAQDYAEYLAETIMSGMSDRPFDQYKMRRYFAKRGSSLTEFETWMVTAEAIELKTEASTLAWTIIDSQAAQDGINLNY